MHDLETLTATVASRLRETAGDGLSPTAVQSAVADGPHCVLVADAAGCLVAASRVALTMLGYSLAELRRLCVDDISAESEQPHIEVLWDAFRRERRQTGHYGLRRRDGSVIRTRYAAVANVVGGLGVAVHEPLAPSPPEPGT